MFHGNKDMPLYINGTNIPNTGNVNFNGTSLTKVIFNNVTVWEKQTNYYYIQNGSPLKTFTAQNDSWYMRQSQSGNVFKVWDTDDDADNEARGSWYVMGEYIPAGYKQLVMQVYTQGWGYYPTLNLKMFVISDSKYNERYQGNSANIDWINNPYDGWPLYHLSTQVWTQGGAGDGVQTGLHTISININGIQGGKYHVAFGMSGCTTCQATITNLYLSN